MADEILVLEGDSGGQYDLLMLFPIASPAQAGGTNVVATPVPTEADGSTPVWPFSLLTAQERTDLDGGTLAYRVVRFHKDPALTNPQLVARAQAIYAEQLADFDAEYTTRYAHIGVRIDAT